MDQDHWIGVDVGTGSVRAGLMNKDGVILHSFTHAITIHNPKQDYYMQSSSEIWKAVCTCVRQVSSKSARIKGIGFDATCSMVVVGEEGQPLRYGLIKFMIDTRIILDLVLTLTMKAPLGTSSCGWTIEPRTNVMSSMPQLIQSSTMSADACQSRCRRQS